ncbi:hypothetical protein [Variovorax gossypii]|uniref:hypothetical protein n=1 Tax=Variovorax gossypii TaxID=1679495 RepID=UPI001477095F|nr:hypothetical protein [Variovorax gossypii]
MKPSIVALAMELAETVHEPAVVDPRNLDWLDREELAECLAMWAPHITVAPHSYFL